ncbi:MAG: Non-ribosomal peptide synthetase module [Benniella sp.]|nr:MAG: Non-ribosomal peptide synthetase module [Benniella sp.]
MTIYLLDKYRQPVPIGAVGELYIGGVGVARGYLNQPELTAKAFLPDPFAGDKDARMYKTGDLARYLPDGNLLYLGRNDHQVKIRGFRIELGEIEACLSDHPLVQSTTVVVVGNGSNKSIVAYVGAEHDDRLVHILRSHLTSILPEYMVPAAIVRLDSLPINSNGKLDRKALPAPDSEAYAHQVYEKPYGDTEIVVAKIWAELLHLDRVSRNDNFFALGGHSLLAVRMIDACVALALLLLSALCSDSHSQCTGTIAGYQPNLRCTNQSHHAKYYHHYTRMLPLITLSQTDIDHIVKRVRGGVANIQDIYALSPLQEATEGDPYLLIDIMAFETRELLDNVWREASLSVTELHLEPSDGPIVDQLKQRIDPRRIRINLTQAPLLRFTIAQDADGRWIVAQLLHHLIGDHTTLEVTSIEVKAFMNGQGRTLPAPQPFRNLIAQARLSHSQDDHERFFKEMLKDIDTPSLPFGLKDVHGQGDNVTTSYRPLPQGLNDRLRKQAKQLGVSVASLCHLAWALVISRTSGESRVVFGTVLFGRMNSGRGSGSAMGLFINTLPLRVDLTGTVRESLLQTHKHLASLLEHEHASLTLAQRCSEIAPGIPLFSAMINYRHNATSADVTSIAPGIEFLEYQERTNYPFSLSVEDFGASLGLTADVVQPFNPNRVCGYMQQALESLVSALEYAPGMATNGLKILPEDEQELLLRTWNTTQQDYSDNLCIHHLFEQQAERTPQATALVFNGYSMTYAELNKRVLAILKVGGAYVPLDPAFASERLRDILMDASPGILVADDHGRKALRDRILSTLVVVDPDVTETDSGSKCTAPGDSLPNPQIPGLTSRSLVYIIYTSGSTGKPKGVMVEHQGLVNLVLTRPEIYGIDSSSRMTQFFSIAFDAHAFDVFMTLCSGGSLHLLPDNIRMDLPRLWDYLERESITHTVLTPAVLQHCNNLPPLNKPLTLITTAEATTATLIKAMHNLIPEGTVVNGYGPTETTVSAMVWECPRDFEGDNVPIGRPIANKTIYLLDKYRQPVPIGAVGELYIGGVGVARGYLNRQELTSKVFLPDPFAGDKDARMYKTGDLARYLPDGNLVYIGRNDNQVKIRGFRIELGEIEARLNDHLLVQSSAVIAMGEGGHKRLVAYVVAKHDDQLVHTLRSHLTSCLPEYMVPTAIVRLDALPINSNGKLDRKALPAPDSDAFARQIYEAPQGDVEITIAHIWAEILNLDRVSRNDNFFALGGHSLLAVRLMNRLVSLDVQMPLSTIFASPTLLSFAESAGQFMGKERSTYSTIHSIPRDEDLPLSFSQQRMWFLAQMEGVSETYHMPMAVRLHGDLNRDAWQRALDTLFARHEALRSVFVTIDGQPQVRILSPQSGMPIRWEDLRGSPDTESQFERMSFKEAKDPFDLVQGPLIRVLMVQLDTNEHVCMVTQHHIVSDGWSSAIFNRELSTLYKAYCNGRSDPLPPLGIQYPDYAAWQRQWLSGDRLETHTTYWKTAFADAPVILNLPTDRPRPLEQSFAGDNIPIHLDSHLSRALKQLCQQHGVTLYMAVLAAWSCVLSRMSGQEDIVIGSPTANRNHHQFEPLIGLFINILALRIDVSGEPTVRQLLERVRKTSLDAQNHQDLPFEQVVDIVQPPRSLSYSPLFQVMFVLQNNEISEWNLPGLDVADANASYDIAKFDLTLGLYESDNEIVGGMSYSTALFDRATVERHVGYLCSMLQAMVEDVDRPVMSVDLLSKTERDLVLRQWNETQQDYPDHLCIHHLFEQQVERTPQATALVFNGQSITYAELNERANRLAHHLIGLGVRPDSLVAICVERSFAMIVGILGILKAGGAYVPLDPAYASNRLRDILFDASPSIAVVDIVGNMALGETVSSMMVVDQNELHDLDPQLEMSHAESITSTQRLCNPQVSALTPYHLAYIIYTSGSTGKPKGVMIEHRGVVNLIHERPESFGISTSSRALLFASLSFDHSVSEIFSALTGGACLHLVEDEIRFDRLRLWEYLKGHSISHVSITPTLLQDSNGLPPLKVPLTLVVMGEALPASLIPQLQKVVPNGKIINDYGPTEITVAAIIWKCPQSFNNGIVPIGRPFANKKAYILDKNQQPVPIGAVGELYIGGVGVARGYLNRPDLTSMVFLPDPFVGDKDARMYKTGDLARYLPDGNIIFLGRSDHQVKIRGFRIELGEIEARLNDHPLVDKAAVIAFGEGSDKRLVGYVVTKPDDTLVKTLRTYLTSCLPEYMVPAAIVRLDSLPTNSNGKLDHKALPVPDSDAFARQIYDAPQGDVETTIAHIWAEVLNIDRVSRNDNFFALGGHSLLAVRLMNRLVHLGVQIPLSTIFARPTLLSFAESAGQFMGKERSTYSTIRSIPRDEDLPLSFSQQRMWFLAQMEGVSETYHMPMAVRLHGDLNRDAWQRALDTLFARHEALRSVFVTIDGQPQVRLLSPQSGMPIRWEDLRGSPDTESQFERMSFKEAKDPFDLVQGPLIRVLMVQLDTNEHVCMVTQHHIVSDGWSSAIFNRELSTLYKAYCNGRSDPLPPLGIQYPDYAAWQRQWLSGDRLEIHTTYWKTAFADAPVILNLPTDRPRPLEQSFAGDNIPIHLDSHLSRALKQLCQQHGVTLYMAVLAAWSCVLSRMSGQEDIVIGSPTANRNHHQFEPLIGLFINILALRIDVSGEPTVRQLLERVRKTSLDAQNHQDLPFEQVVDIVQPPRSLSYSPLFQVMFVLQNNEISEWNLPGLDVADANASYDIAKFDLTLGLYESDNEIVGGMSYSTALFDRATVERHVGYLCSMLQAMVEDVDRPVMSVDLLSKTERDLVLRQWNETQQDYPDHLCIHHLFEQQVDRTPQATALVFSGQSITYAELNERANRLAHHLIGLGVLPDTCVAISVNRSLALIVGVLAILKAGGAYVPFDPTNPRDRLTSILEDSRPKVMLVETTGFSMLREAGVLDSNQKDTVYPVMVDPNDNLSLHSANPRVPTLTSRHLAYIIYTSGSTGKPKGVMIEHQGVVSRLQEHTLNTSSRFLQFTPLSFDVSVLDMFTTLCSGASLHLLQEDSRRDLSRLWTYLQENSITHTSLTATVLQDIKGLSPLKTPLNLTFVGEILPPALPDALQSILPDGSTITNEYGPTEATVAVVRWNCKSSFNGDLIPIGRPIANVRIYLLDTNMLPVPLGAMGEVYIGGVGVARGYLNRPELTAGAFVPDPFVGGKDARMYKTGDLARYLPDGNIIFLGRSDHQVKIRGFRIELGEIEARLNDHPLVDKAAVIAFGEGSDKRLVGYVVTKPDDTLVKTLRTYLTSCLPEYMVPAAIVRLDSLPTNSNGKLDHKALPVPDSDAFARQIYDAPQGDVETTIAHIWAEVLNIDRVSRNDNFFALGGHSLLAVRLMNRLVLLGVQLPLSTIFASPTLSSFAESVSRCPDKERSTYSTIHPIPRGEDLPLSFSQQRMWFLTQMEGISETYHIPFVARLRGDLNRDAWQRAFDTLFARHEALRSAFVAIDGQPQVRLLPHDSGIPIAWVDLQGTSDTELQLEKMITKEAKDPFDLAKGPLIRVLVVQLDTNEYVCLITQHHIVSDGWSSAIFHRELSTLYSSYCNGKPDPLPPLSIQYPDYAAWQRQWLSGDRLETHTTYWKTALSDAPVLLNLPTDRPRPPEQSFAGDSIPIQLDSHLTRALKQLCQQHGVTLYMAVLAAWSCVLSRMSGQDDIVIGSPSANRNHHQIESLIGLFVNTLALRIDLSGDPTVRQLLERIQKTSLDAQNHQDLPFEQVVDIVQPPRSLSHSPLFQVMFTLQNNEASEWDLPGLDVVDADSGYDIAKFDLTLGLSESDHGIIGGMSYSTALFDRATVERHVGYLCSMLQAMVEDVDRPVMTVDLLSKTERDLVLGTWNKTQQDYPDELCIHHLFEQQVERTPQATALVFNGQSISYSELNERANRLAYHLIELGVQPDSLVAICVERSFAMIIGILAILKAGGAYVPLDPSYPKDRLAYILEDATPAIALVDTVGRTALREANEHLQHQKGGAPWAMIDPNDQYSSSTVDPEPFGLTSRHLAYVIYTSGSTGRPKGVMVEHQGVVNYALSRIDEFDLGANSRVLQFTSLSFDVSVMEMFTAFYSGASLHLLEDHTRLDRQELWGYIERHAITQAVLPPAILKECKNCSPLRTHLTLISAGEELPATLVRALQRLVPNGRVINEYGPTEITIIATSRRCPSDFNDDVVPIGRPIPNKTTYLLDKNQQPVPIGAIGELYIGGVGIARGYYNQPELTSKAFLPDPFTINKDARMYKTGDLARYLPDGNIVYLGRNDHQVKIRGFRIELGEIEARLSDHPLVQSAAVVAMGEEGDKRLVAYVVAKHVDQLAHTLRAHLTSCLPDYMIPAAIVRLDALPINSNGKLDRKALPAPDTEAYAHQVYEKPQGDTETVVAKIWAELLHLDRVSRNDNFFALGGHSLLAVQMIERLRRFGLTFAVSALFKTPTLSAFVQSLDVHKPREAPTNLIMPDITAITPDMLPLISLSQEDIDHVIKLVPGGVANIQDIYALSPLQEGILFHHLLATEGDPYLLVDISAFETRELLDKYLDATQMVVNRHDILRTAIVYEHLSEHAQVVLREAPLSVKELELDPSDGSIVDQLRQRIDPRRNRIDLTQAPLLRFTIAQDADGRWIVAQLIHHLIGDHTTLEAIAIETKAFMDGQGHTLLVPQPFRNLISQARSDHTQEDHEKFFKGMLKDIDTPSLPFGLKDVHGQGDNVTTSYRLLPQGLNDRLRRQAKQLGVSVASLCHLALALVISRTSGESRVVFGTVLFGRMNSGRGSDSAMGLFINTLPLRVDLAGTVRESVLQTHERLASLLEHEHASLTLAQRCSEISPGTPLFSAMMNYRHNTTSADMTSIAPGIEYLGYQERTNYPFTLSVEDFGVSLGLTADVVQPFNPNRVCGYMQQALDSLVSFLEHAPDTMMTQELNILPRDEQELLIRTWNTTEQDYPNHLCIHHLFEQQVERTPQVTALVFNGQSLSYSELNGRANGLAHHLIGLGVQPDSLVAICVNRSFAMIVGVLAILKAGGAYVALDPSYPKERLAYILEDAAPDVALADTVGHVYLREASQHIHGKDITSIVMIDPFDHPSTSVNPEAPGLTSRHLAYIIYTSGSTGRPKGVMVEHQGVVNYTLSRIDDYALDISGKVLQFASLNFDLSVMEIFTALSSGASLHLLEDHTRLDRRELWGYLEQHMITQAILPPAILQECKNCSPLSAKLTLISTGEELSATLLRDLQRLIPNGCIVNECGATEVTVNATSWRCPRDFNSDAVPIGRPFANMTIYLLDKYRQPVPIGAVGELYIGGVGVARGYLNQPELTAKAFLPDPFAGDKDARMYKTGDLARYLPDGNLLYLGRNDHQVKIRGFRIELGEIEACLSDHPLVQSTTVVVVGNGSNKSIVAYVGAEHDDRLVHILRSHLTSILPEYMVPAAIVRLDSLPINSNGKLDRKALPAPDSEAYAHQVYEKPYGDTEIVVAKIWAELLHLDRVSRNDNFFALGGHSLLAVRMIERLRRIGLTLAVSALFKTPTLSALVQSLDISQICDAPTNLIMPNTTTITPEMLPLITLSQTDIDHIVKRVRGGVANIQDIYALSPLQEGILFHHLLATEGDPYLLIDIMAFETRELLDKYLDAIQMVMNRHDILRTAVLHENLSTPAQVVWREASLSVTELELDPSSGPIVHQLKQRLDPRKIRIDITQAPLLRFTIAQETDGRWILVELLHHLIGDHSTLEAILNETEAFMDGLGHTLSAPQPFRNLIAQTKVSQSQEDHERFFKDMLVDIDTPSLPFGLKDVHGQGNNVTNSYRLLPQDLNDRLRRQAKQLGVSVASLCHLAWAQVISKTSGEDRVVFGTVLFGRMNSGHGSDSAMGLFINTLPLRIDLTGTVHESVLHTHERLASLLEHEHASLVLAQRCSSVPQGTPLFSGMLNYRHNATSSDTPSVMKGIEFLEGEERTNYPFTLAVEDFGGSLGLTAKVVQPISPTRVCGYMQQALESLVSSMEHAPDMSIRELSVLPEDEQELLLRTWNTTQQDYPIELCIHHLFEQQVERTPQATALVFNGQSITYADLNERANRLSHHLIGLGVRPDSLVAICVERSFAMIVGILGILKAGGAYVPLDPAYVSNRLKDILFDASPSIIVVDAVGSVAIGEVISGMTVVDPNELQDLGQRLEMSNVEGISVEGIAPKQLDRNPHVPGLSSFHLAYIIYTSGSTGKPKGVMIEHRGVVNLIHHRPTMFGIHSSSRVLQFTSMGFDHSVSEIFSTLTRGATLYLVLDDIRLDQRELCSYIERNVITHVSLTPALLQDTKVIPVLSSLMLLIVMGDVFPATLARNLQPIVPNGFIFNCYGPTEITVGAIAWNCPQNFDGEIVPIGRPTANKRIYLLDKNGQSVPLGAVGEMYIGGIGVARGYLNRPELTATVFLPDPFAGDKDARMYKTGDMARYLPDGNIVYLGRNDHQVKIRGFRIELGEIEARLCDYPLVQSAAVVAMGDGSDRRLVAYIVAKHNDQLTHSLRSYLTSCLPDYMVPAAFVHLDGLPLSANGKLDRLQLPQPDDNAMARQPYEAPCGTFENALMTIWMDLLHVDKIGRHDNFFTLGGHSLLAVRMVTQIRSLMGFKITLGTLFTAPTIAELVPHLLTAGNSQEDAFDVLLPIRPRGMRLPLFCVHHGFGISWGYIGLSKHLHPDQPIYGLQARGFVDGAQFATTIEDMALDYIEQIKRIQPHGPYCLVGYSFGGKVVHTMAAHIERQGERVALLAIMDTAPRTLMTENQASMEEQDDEDQGYADDIHLFVNRVRDALPDSATPYIEKFLHVRSKLSQLFRNHHTLFSCNCGMTLFRAMDRKTPISPDEWKPYIMGEIDVFDINCGHVEMDLAAPLAEIGGVLAQRLNEIHIREMREL